MCSKVRFLSVFSPSPLEERVSCMFTFPCMVMISYSLPSFNLLSCSAFPAAKHWLVSFCYHYLKWNEWKWAMASELRNIWKGRKNVWYYSRAQRPRRFRTHLQVASPWAPDSALFPLLPLPTSPCPPHGSPSPELTPLPCFPICSIFSSLHTKLYKICLTSFPFNLLFWTKFHNPVFPVRTIKIKNGWAKCLVFQEKRIHLPFRTWPILKWKQVFTDYFFMASSVTLMLLVTVGLPPTCLQYNLLILWTIALT